MSVPSHLILAFPNSQENAAHADDFEIVAHRRLMFSPPRGGDSSPARLRARGPKARERARTCHERVTACVSNGSGAISYDDDMNRRRLTSTHVRSTGTLSALAIALVPYAFAAGCTNDTIGAVEDSGNPG